MSSPRTFPMLSPGSSNYDSSLPPKTEVTPQKGVEWSPAARDYVRRAFEPSNAIPGISQSEMQNRLKEILNNYEERNKLHDIDWPLYALPQQLLLLEQQSHSSAPSGLDLLDHGFSSTDPQVNPRHTSPQLELDDTPQQSSTDSRASPFFDAERIAARENWDHMFGTRQVKLGRDSESPFKEGRRLGGGGFGIVHETTINGIPLALKRTYTRSLTTFQLNEIKILGKISEKRHRHVVELIGSYIHEQQRTYELGLLIWPVAQCDLAAFLQDMDILDRVMTQGGSATGNDYSSACDMVRKLSVARYYPIIDYRQTAKSILIASFGCMISAIEYLHEQSIRHKDLKPSQILLSQNGLWLTDFGWSNDMSDFSSSLTSNGDNITKRYQSPERANKQPCGRSEDIFALGCIFFEMWLRVRASRLCITDEEEIEQEQEPMNHLATRGFCFHENMEKINEYIEMLGQTYWAQGGQCDGLCTFMLILRKMLSREPEDRPPIEIVLRVLALSHRRLKPYGYFSFFAPCCEEQVQYLAPRRHQS